jgi:Peptidase A4 family
MHRRLPSFRSAALLACVPVLASMAMLASTGTASAAHAPATPRAEMRAALEHLLAGWHGTNHALGGHAVVHVGLKTAKSLNWSGYFDDNSTGLTYSKVSATWAQPKATCTATTSLAVFFVGIDGAVTGSNTVEQAGSIILCSGGVPSYGTWWELFPANSIQVVGTTVVPGDKIAASVSKSGTLYTFKVTDSTHTANSFTKTATCAATTCKDLSAEFIAERPSSSTGTLFPLSNFGTWTLKGASVTSGATTGSISKFPDTQLTMVNSKGKTLALPGALNSTGNQFKDVWKASS